MLQTRMVILRKMGVSAIYRKSFFSIFGQKVDQQWSKGLI